MLANMLHSAFDCPCCGAHHHDGVWAFHWGALAGEAYELGDRVYFDEPFSFFRRVVGHPDTTTTLLIEGQCPVTDQPLWAWLSVDEGRLSRVHTIMLEPPPGQ